jgi:hypothetical protein
MSEQDMKINSRVRKILVEKNLNCSFLDTSSRSGVVSIRGEVKKLSGAPISDNQVGKLLLQLETTILQIKDVKRVSISIFGWEKRRGRWKKEGE